MDKGKMVRRAGKGWKVGTVTEFLELSPEEAADVEMKVARASRRQHLCQRMEVDA